MRTGEDVRITAENSRTPLSVVVVYSAEVVTEDYDALKLTDMDNELHR